MEERSMSGSGLEWEDLALYCWKPVELQQQSCFPMPSLVSNALYGNDVGSKFPISATHGSANESRGWLKEEPLSPFKSTYCDTFSMQRICGVFSSSGACSSFPNTSSKSAVSSLPASSFPMKRSRASYNNLQNPCCQVEGCNLDLKAAKDYHRRHRICESHSKSPTVIVAGMERRFCQQCSRFHELSEFDDKKRSCRRRLSDHNARRRRAQPETLQLTSPGLSSAFYAHKMQQNVLLNGLPISQPGAIDGTLCFPSDEIRSSVSTLQLDSTRLPQNQCLHVPTADDNLASDLLSAHSLLSANSWSLDESQMEGSLSLVHESYISTARHLDSESNHLSFFHHNNASASVPPRSLMNTVSFDSLAAVDQALEYRLDRAPYESGSFYPSLRNL